MVEKWRTSFFVSKSFDAELKKIKKVDPGLIIFFKPTKTLTHGLELVFQFYCRWSSFFVFCKVKKILTYEKIGSYLTNTLI